jgi:murein DD-endopeptidase MepM/ murein hydrolase activator NlpD
MRISVPVGAFEISKAKFIVMGFAAFMLAGCSSSIERFAADYSNPSDSDPVYTGSVPKTKKVASRPISQKYVAPKYVAQNEEVIVQSPISSAPLVKPKAPVYDYAKAYKSPKLAYNNVPAQPNYAAPAYKAPVYKKPNFSAPAEETIADSSPDVQAPVYKQAAPVAIAKPKFTYKQPNTVASGTLVTVGPGMTLYGIAKANHMSVQQLAEANHMKAPYSVSQGQQLRIPGSHMAALPETVKPKSVSLAEEEQTSTPIIKSTKAGGSYTVASGDTLFSIGRKYGVSPFAIADLNKLPHNKALALGQSLKIPAGANASVAQADAPQQEDANSSDAPSEQIAAAEIPAKKPGALTLPKDTPTEPVATAATPIDAGSNLALRWPLKGKVISGFGAKPNGLKNEGINIAVPEGTNIQAAEAGVVAYAGNELKGYGNLVLVRHPGGYVTAYAHASQLLVKRGDTVKRGDVIAKAGQTGAVQSPQLHFEVRKGATALDPNKFLTSSTASN